MNHESNTEDHPNRYGNPSPPPVAIQKFKHVNSFRKIVRMPPNYNWTVPHNSAGTADPCSVTRRFGRARVKFLAAFLIA